MLIGLAGKAGSGKDTAGTYLRTQYGFQSYAFAQPLKIGLAAMGFAEPKRDEKELPIPGFDFSWRQAAQKLGTEWGRELDPDIWLKLAEYKMRTVPWLAITDVRFENEAASIRKHGGHIFHLTGREYEMQSDTQQHPSEAGIAFNPATDYMINNQTTLDNLYARLRDAINQIEFKQTTTVVRFG